MKKNLIVGKNIFIPIDNDFKNLEQKYISCSINGVVLNPTQYTRKDIEAQVNDPKYIKECQGFENLIKVWKG